MSKEDLDNELNSLVDQLKDNTLVNNHIQKQSDEIKLSKEDIEDFVVQNSGKLIIQSLGLMDQVRDYIIASSDPDNISAYADLIKASSNAIESLNKLVVQNKRSATAIMTKQMDVDSRKGIEDVDNSDKLIGTREEVFRKILSEAKVIEAEEVNPIEASDNL